MKAQEQVQWERVGLDIAVPSPPQIPLACRAPQSEGGRTAAAVVAITRRNRVHDPARDRLDHHPR